MSTKEKRIISTEQFFKDKLTPPPGMDKPDFAQWSRAVTIFQQKRVESGGVMIEEGIAHEEEQQQQLLPFGETRLTGRNAWVIEPTEIDQEKLHITLVKQAGGNAKEREQGIEWQSVAQLLLQARTFGDDILKAREAGIKIGRMNLEREGSGQHPTYYMRDRNTALLYTIGSDGNSKYIINPEALSNAEYFSRFEEKGKQAKGIRK